ncbi:MAG: CHAD domain-containing protein [Pirellulales bacterium]
MGRNTKWIESQPDDSVEDVARRALEARLERLWHYLELSVRQQPSETEDVHQLRVFARRTAAAMEIFADWLPRRRGRWMSKKLKRIRKAAGEARDLDVLRMRWTERMHEMPSGQASLLLEQVKRRRRKGQWPIEDAYHRLVRNRFERRAAKFIKRVRLRTQDAAGCGQRLGCLARVALGRLVVPFLQAARAEMADAEALHAFRIQSKQVRYAMEIFGGAFDAEFRQELYTIVESLQDRLGAVNDHVTAQRYLAGWRGETDSCAVHQAIDVGIEHEQRWFELSRQEFLAWWTHERREDLRRHFARYVELDAAPAPPDSQSVG